MAETSETESPEKIWLQRLLNAAKQDIIDAMDGELSSKNFGAIRRVVKFAEDITSADGRPEFRGVCQHIVTECEFDMGAKNLFAALVAHLSDGNVAIYNKFRRLQSTHAQVEAGRQAVVVARSQVEREREAVEHERTSLQQLRGALELSAGAALPDLPALPAMSEVVDEEPPEIDPDAGQGWQGPPGSAGKS